MSSPRVYNLVTKELGRPPVEVELHHRRGHRCRAALGAVHEREARLEVGQHVRRHLHQDSPQACGRRAARGRQPDPEADRQGQPGHRGDRRRPPGEPAGAAPGARCAAASHGRAGSEQEQARGSATLVLPAPRPDPDRSGRRAAGWGEDPRQSDARARSPSTRTLSATSSPVWRSGSCWAWRSRSFVSTSTTRSRPRTTSSPLPRSTVVGLIPALPDWKNRDATQLVSMAQPGSPAAEAYRSVRTSVEFLGLDQPIGSLQVTSAIAGEGKTTTLANLATTFARAGQRVIVLCCDMRRPRIHEFFGLTNRVGFTSVLLGDAPIADAIQRVPGELPIGLVASGPLSAEPGRAARLSACRRDRRGARQPVRPAADRQPAGAAGDRRARDRGSRRRRAPRGQLGVDDQARHAQGSRAAPPGRRAPHRCDPQRRCARSRSTRTSTATIVTTSRTNRQRRPAPTVATAGTESASRGEGAHAPRAERAGVLHAVNTAS